MIWSPRSSPGRVVVNYYIWQVMPMCMAITNVCSLGMANPPSMVLLPIVTITDSNYWHNVFGVIPWNRWSMLYTPPVVVGGVADVDVVETAADDDAW